MKKATWQLYNDTVHAEKYLFKFLSCQNLKKFLSTGEIWFSLAREFGDKMECTTIDDFANGELNIEEIQDRQNKHLISCWHCATKEVLSMWDAYAATPEKRRKVALRFLKNDLILLVKAANSLPSNIIRLIYGRVRYKNILGRSKAALQNRRVRYVSFRKEYAFRYEREYRFVISLSKSFEQKGWGCKIGDVTKLPFQILVNPLLEKVDYTATRQALLRSRHKDKVTESGLTRWLRPESWN